MKKKRYWLRFGFWFALYPVFAGILGWVGYMLDGGSAPGIFQKIAALFSLPLREVSFLLTKISFVVGYDSYYGETYFGYPAFFVVCIIVGIIVGYFYGKYKTTTQPISTISRIN